MAADLRELVYDHDEIADLDPAARRLALREIVARAGVADVAASVARLADDIEGFGPISALMSDPSITDILINGPYEVWIEADGTLGETDISFGSTGNLVTWCERLIAEAGGRVDTSHPIADARLRDGSRMHVVLPPVAPDGPLVSIRLFPDRMFTLDDLVADGSMSGEQAALLRAAVIDGCSIVVSGATGAGKTTLLNALLAIVPVAQRVVVIEELPELRTGMPDRVSLLARSANAEGRGEVSLEQLVRASLRMRPDRIVIGEVRGSEALPALWAMRTGHSGTMLSVHAASATDAKRRLVDLALMAERAPAETTLVEEVGSMVDVYVHMVRREGRRLIEEIIDSR